MTIRKIHMRHTKSDCAAHHIFLSGPGLQCGNCLACDYETEDIYHARNIKLIEAAMRHKQVVCTLKYKILQTVNNALTDRADKQLTKRLSDHINTHLIKVYGEYELDNEYKKMSGENKHACVSSSISKSYDQQRLYINISAHYYHKFKEECNALEYERTLEESRYYKVGSLKETNPSIEVWNIPTIEDLKRHTLKMMEDFRQDAEVYQQEIQNIKYNVTIIEKRNAQTKIISDGWKPARLREIYTSVLDIEEIR